MKKTAKKLLKSALKTYKPIDTKLRKIKPYERVSRAGHSLYRRQLGNAAAIKKPFPALYAEKWETAEIQPNTFLFECYGGSKISCNPYGVYRALRADPKFANARAIWVTKKDTIIPADVAEDPMASLVRKDTEEYVAALLTTEYLVNNWIFPGYFIRKPGQNYANVWHGIPFKHLGLDIGPMGFENGPPLRNSGFVQKDFLQATAFPLAGNYAIDTTVRPYGSFHLTKPRCVATGSPRMDITRSTDRSDAIKRFGLPADKKIVLFAPTWRGRFGAVQTEIDTQIAAVLEIATKLSEEYYPILSIHHGVKSKLNSMPDLGVRIVEDHENINEIIACVDILVGDYSSIFSDFLPLNRPIVLYAPDEENYRSDHGLYVNLRTLPATVVEKLPDLVEAVQSAKPPSSFKSYEKKVPHFTPFEDGQAGERALASLMEPPVTEQKDSRSSVLIYPGAMLSSGITASFISLMEQLANEDIELTIVIDAKFTDDNQVAREMVDLLPSKASLVLRVGGRVFTRDENKAYAKLLSSPNDLTDHDEELLSVGFTREWRRIFGDREFDTVIDFAGYSTFWTALFAHGRAKSKVIYQHSDMAAEATSPHVTRKGAKLLGVFASLKKFDKFVGVSSEITAINRQALSRYVRAGSKFIAAPNPISPQRITEWAQRPLYSANPALSLAAADDRFYKFCCVGRLSPEKGQLRLIRAFSGLISRLRTH